MKQRQSLFFFFRQSLLKEVSLRKGKEFDAAEHGEEVECFRKETT